MSTAADFYVDTLDRVLTEGWFGPQAPFFGDGRDRHQGCGVQPPVMVNSPGVNLAARRRNR